MKIKKSNGEIAILICFTTKKENFSSASERNRFYWGLYGRKQIVIREGKKYEYFREGILDGIPHIKVDNSVFIVAERYLSKIIEYFNHWKRKVEIKIYPVMLDKKEARRLVNIKIE